MRSECVEEISLWIRDAHARLLQDASFGLLDEALSVPRFRMLRLVAISITPDASALNYEAWLQAIPAALPRLSKSNLLSIQIIPGLGAVL